VLAIRLQRQGRSGHAHYRVVVQDSRWSPKRGKVVAHIGSYDPHNKTAILDKEKAESYLKNGAHPSERVAILLQNEGVKLPKWVDNPAKKEGKIRNPEKLRKNQPKEEKPAEPAAASEEKVEDTTEAPAANQPEAEQPEAETPKADAPDVVADKTE
jgi:small subunit ribosomal protein S16